MGKAGRHPLATEDKLVKVATVYLKPWERKALRTLVAAGKGAGGDGSIAHLMARLARSYISLQGISEPAQST